jgi:hypothetical protein
MKYSALLLIILTFSASAAASHASHLKYIRQGSSQDIQTRAEAGIAMMGGGDDLDEFSALTATPITIPTSAACAR